MQVTVLSLGTHFILQASTDSDITTMYYLVYDTIHIYYRTLIFTREVTAFELTISDIISVFNREEQKF